MQKKPRKNVDFKRFFGLYNTRGWENRTPAKSFGDSCHTIWPIPYFKINKYLTYLQNRTQNFFSKLFLWIWPPPSFRSACSSSGSTSVSPVCSSCCVMPLRKFHLAPLRWNDLRTNLSLRLRLAFAKCSGQALDQLVAVSCARCRASTPALSTSSSSRGLTSKEWDISSWGGLHA